MSKKSTDESVINHLVTLASEGDDDAMSELISLIMPSAKAKAARLNSGSSRISDEDLVQEGMLGFLDAVKQFDPSKGNFVGFVSTCIENRILSALRKISNSGNLALSSAISIDDDSLLGTDDPVALVDSSEAANSIMKKAKSILSDMEFSILCLRVDGLSYSQISEKLSCSEKSVDNALQRIKKKLL